MPRFLSWLFRRYLKVPVVAVALCGSAISLSAPSGPGLQDYPVQKVSEQVDIDLAVERKHRVEERIRAEKVARDRADEQVKLHAKAAEQARAEVEAWALVEEASRARLNLQSAISASATVLE